MKWRIVLPSWSPLEADLQGETGCRYAAFIPLGGRPLYHHIATSPAFSQADADVVVVLNEQASELAPEALEGRSIRSVRLSRSSSIGETVLAGLDNLSEGMPVI